MSTGLVVMDPTGERPGGPNAAAPPASVSGRYGALDISKPAAMFSSITSSKLKAAGAGAALQ